MMLTVLAGAHGAPRLTAALRDPDSNARRGQPPWGQRRPLGAAPRPAAADAGPGAVRGSSPRLVVPGAAGHRAPRTRWVQSSAGVPVSGWVRASTSDSGYPQRARAAK